MRYNRGNARERTESQSRGDREGNQDILKDPHGAEKIHSFLEFLTDTWADAVADYEISYGKIRMPSETQVLLVTLAPNGSAVRTVDHNDLPDSVRELVETAEEDSISIVLDASKEAKQMAMKNGCWDDSFAQSFPHVLGCPRQRVRPLLEEKAQQIHAEYEIQRRLHEDRGQKWGFNFITKKRA